MGASPASGVGVSVGGISVAVSVGSSAVSVINSAVGEGGSLGVSAADVPPGIDASGMGVAEELGGIQYSPVADTEQEVIRKATVIIEMKARQLFDRLTLDLVFRLAACIGFD